MRRLAALVGICVLFCSFCLWGCQRKGDGLEMDLQSQITQIGRTYVGSGANDVLLLAPDGSGSGVWRSQGDMLTWQETFALSQEIEATSPEAVRNFTFDGTTYRLKYISTYTRDGKAVHRYGLFEEDITADMMAGVPTDQQDYFHSHPDEPVSTVSFVTTTQKVSLISHLPGGYFADGTETEAFLKQKAIDIAKAYTDEPFETYTYSCQTAYEIYDTPERKVLLSNGSAFDFYTMQPNEKLDYYEIRFTHYVKKSKTDESVTIRFYGCGGMTIQYSNTAFTEQDYAKIGKTDQNTVIKHLAAFMVRHLADGWELTEWQATDVSFCKNNEPDDAFLYLTVSFLLKLGHTTDEQYERTLRLYLYAEIV